MWYLLLQNTRAPATPSVYSDNIVKDIALISLKMCLSRSTTSIDISTGGAYYSSSLTSLSSSL
jgi:hypothetical protein